MDRDALLGLFLETATLKWMPRTGWGMRGVPQAESVAEHSFGVAFVALALADALNGESDEGARSVRLDVEKVMIMALLHDLAEVRLTDLPAPAVQLLPEGIKSRAEATAMDELLAPLQAMARWKALWQEFKDQSSAEGQLVRDADKLEMMVQCLRYEQAGSRGLDEFWQVMDERAWFYAVSADLYARLRAMRPARGA
ncbi:MAG: HD domain-containing protein [Anaerolineae bacterium]